jgi:type IV pilus assembly protein PilM
VNFITNRFRATTGYVGIAFEERDVRMVQVREHREGLRVTGGAIVPMNEGDAGARSLSESLRAAFITGGFTGRPCVVSIPRSEVWTQIVRMPDMPDRELDEAVAWEASDRFGVDRDAMQCDWIETESTSGDRREILIIAVSRGCLDPRLEAVLSAGLRPVAVDTGFGGVARLFSRRFRRDADASSSRAVLDVGPSGSMLMVLRGRGIAFCKPVSIGGRHLDARVAERLDLDTVGAGELRRARLEGGTPLDPATDGAVADAVKPVLAELAREAMLCLRHYSVSVRGGRLDNLVLSGADATEPGLLDLVQTASRLPSTLDDESNCLGELADGLAQVMPGMVGPAGGWAAAAGLSLRGIEPRRSSGRRAA